MLAEIFCTSDMHYVHSSTCKNSSRSHQLSNFISHRLLLKNQRYIHKPLPWRLGTAPCLMDGVGYKGTTEGQGVGIEDSYFGISPKV